jgi:hypothetical protein
MKIYLYTEQFVHLPDSSAIKAKKPQMITGVVRMMTIYI